MLNGWKEGLSDNEYHNGDGLSSSDIKYLERSPGHWKAKVFKETDALRVGRAFHCAVLEPGRFDIDLRLMPKINKRTNEGKEKYANFMSDTNEHSIVIDSTEDEMIQGMKQSILNQCGEFFQGGFAERSGFFNSTAYNTLLKIRPDYLKGNTMYDIKSCQDAREFAVTRDIRKYNYDLSAAFYLDIGNQIEAVALENVIEHFIWVFVEKTAPFSVAVYEAHESLLQKGRDKYFKGLNNHKKAIETNDWFGYSNETIQLLGD